MKLDHKLMLIFVAVLTVVAGILIAVGVMKHKENDLLHVVWTDGKVSAYFDEPGEGRDALVWKDTDFPLRVKVLNVDRTPQWRMDALKASVRSFNTQLRCDIFEIVSSGDGDVFIELEAPREVWTQNLHAGSTTHYISANGSMKANIEIYGVPNMEAALNAIEHELGHAVGLAHDDFEMSLMHPNAVSNSQFSRLTDHDKKTLRNLYCDN